MSVNTQANFFKIQTSNNKENLALNILNLLQQGKASSIEEISQEIGAKKEEIASLINGLIKKDILKVSSGENGEIIKFKPEDKKLIGVGFCNNECTVTLVDFEGTVKESETFEIPLLKKWKGRNKEVSEIADQIAEKTSLKDSAPCCVGVAISQEMMAKNSKSAEILTKGIKKIFGCKPFIAKESTASGYAEKNLSNIEGKDLVYLHSDVGLGVVIKGESIFEANVNSENSLYLSSWPQYRIVDNAKSLVSKGVGTDIVGMSHGDIDNISLDLILKAAKNNDELAQDLVKRAALALGVRAAYLVNMFTPEAIILGGGVESEEGDFVKYAKESIERFILKKMKSKVMVLPSKLGIQNSSIGAALLCRRELFMEV